MSEGWPSNQEHYPPRSFNNSNNYRPRRDGNTTGGPGGRPSYQGNGGGGGFGQRQNGYGQNGGGGGYGQSYGDRSNFGQSRPPRNFSGAPRNGNGNGGGGGTFQVVGGESSVIEIDPSKVGMVIGRGGGKIREIQQNFQVHVKIGKRNIIFYYYHTPSFMSIASEPNSIRHKFRTKKN